MVSERRQDGSDEGGGGMILAAIVIFSCEFIAIRLIERKYMRGNETILDPLEFVSRASLDDILRYRYHINGLWPSMTLLTIECTRKLHL